MLIEHSEFRRSLSTFFISGATTRGPGSVSGGGYTNNCKMEMPLSANTSGGDLYDMNRAGYDQGYTQQEVEGKPKIR